MGWTLRITYRDGVTTFVCVITLDVLTEAVRQFPAVCLVTKCKIKRDSPRTFTQDSNPFLQPLCRLVWVI